MQCWQGLVCTKVYFSECDASLSTLLYILGQSVTCLSRIITTCSVCIPCNTSAQDLTCLVRFSNVCPVCVSCHDHRSTSVPMLGGRRLSCAALAHEASQACTAFHTTHHCLISGRVLCCAGLPSFVLCCALLAAHTKATTRCTSRSNCWHVLVYTVATSGVPASAVAGVCRREDTHLCEAFPL